MSRKFLVMLLVAGLALTASACDREDSDEAEETDEAVQEVVEEEEEEAPTADAVEAADFQEQMVGSICYAYENCDNEILREGLLTSAFMVVAMGIEMGGGPVDDDLRASYTELGERLEASGEESFPAEECPALFNVITGFFGVDSERLTAAIDDGALTYDAEAAGACVAHIRNLPSACEQETEIEGEFSLDQFQAVADEHEEELEAYMEGCSGIFMGTRSVGDACTHDYECANEVDCQWDAEAGAGECAEADSAPF